MFTVVMVTAAGFGAVIQCKLSISSRVLFVLVELV